MPRNRHIVYTTYMYTRYAMQVLLAPLPHDWRQDKQCSVQYHK